MPMYDVTCRECKHENEMFAHRPELLEPCRKCQGAVEVTPRARHTGTVIPDEIPGGIDIHHALCHPDGTPRRFYSKSAMRRAAAELGWTNAVEHKTLPGTDKSPHTTRWI